MERSEIHYAILGDGRLARHMRHYLRLLGLKYSGWGRRATSLFNTWTYPDADARLNACISPATHVLLLVSDGAIAELLRTYPQLHGRRLVHCAGALSLPGVAGAHPLMTFADEPYSLSKLQRIPFLVDEGHRFEELLPGLPNPHYSIPVEDKALYHALCVIAGNFPQILWAAVRNRFDLDLGLPPDLMENYLRQSLANHLADPEGALTGPLARGDTPTIHRNLAALEHDPLEALYRAFVTFQARKRRAETRSAKELSS